MSALDVPHLLPCDSWDRLQQLLRAKVVYYDGCIIVAFVGEYFT